jgi:AP-2 complex subunit alpha
MPVFPERESALVSRLHARGEKAQDKRTWVIGGRDENVSRGTERFKSFRKTTAESAAISESAANARAAVAAGRAGAASAVAAANDGGRAAGAEAPSRQGTLVDDMMGAEGGNGETEDIMASLAGLDLSGSAVQDEPLLPETRQRSESAVSAASATSATSATVNGASAPPTVQTATLGGVNPALLAPLTVAPNIEKVRWRGVWQTRDARLTRDQWLERLSYSTDGVLYEDKQIQIGLKAEYHGHLGRIALFLGNKISTPFTSLSAAIDNPSSPALLVNFHDSPVREIAPLAQIQELIHLECKDVFTEPPVLRLTYLAGSFTTLVLRLPVFLNRFVEGVTLEQAPFFERWKIIGGE